MFPEVAPGYAAVAAEEMWFVAVVEIDEDAVTCA